ncbi:MAG: ATP-grasp ribosomal peptide maturase [Micromonosporaceae bacterium]
MNTASTVLVLTGADDDTADAVITQLDKRDVAVIRMDIGDFPRRLSLAATLAGPCWSGRLATRDTFVELASVRSVYYWRPTEFRFGERMSMPDAVFAAAEARHGLGGVLATIPARWVNDPSLAARAEYKPLQLQVAAAAGLAVPPTLVTSVHAAAVEFAAAHGPVVVKTLSSVVLGDAAGQPQITYTTPVNPAEIDPGTFATTANLLQRWVPKVMDCRVTMVGRRPYAAVIRADSALGYVDWRADYASLRYTPIDVPEAVTTGMIAYLEAFGLHYAAFDFGIDRDGMWWYYEANPAGQWLWIEQATGLEIAAGLAELLTEGSAA